MNNPLLSKVRPWCIGRFVFDRPLASEISSESYEFRGEKLTTTHNVTRSAYQAQVAGREKELRANQRVNPVNLDQKTGLSWLEKVFAPTQDSRVFLFQKGVTKSVQMPFETEGYMYLDNAVLHTSGLIGETGLNDAEGIYNDIYRRIRPRDNWTVPTDSGFCFDGGIVTGSSTYTEEVSQSFALMPGRPALVAIRMRDSVQQDQGQPLTQNLSGLKAQLDRMPGSYRIIRQRKRVVAGIDAEEVLFELKDGSVTAFRFYLLAPGRPGTLAQPHTSIELLLGAPPRANLPPDQATSPVDEAGALAVWDALLNGLRLRPGAV